MPPAAQRCARAVIEYDGTAFAGSQVQPNARTVQGELEEALNRLTGERVRVRFAGRTDAGVHATGQVDRLLPAASRRRSARRSDGRELRRRLNAALPADLAVRSLRAAPGASTRGATHVAGSIATGSGWRASGEPLDRHRTLEIDDRLDVAAMQAAAARSPGRRDFAALGSARTGPHGAHLSEVTVLRRGDLVEVTVTANAFLRRMVRSLVAVLLEVGRGGIATGGGR